MIGIYILVLPIIVPVPKSLTTSADSEKRAPAR
jgi:hypothetical protein